MVKPDFKESFLSLPPALPPSFFLVRAFRRQEKVQQESWLYQEVRAISLFEARGLEEKMMLHEQLHLGSNSCRLLVPGTVCPLTFPPSSSLCCLFFTFCIYLCKSCVVLQISLNSSLPCLYCIQSKCIPSCSVSPLRTPPLSGLRPRFESWLWRGPFLQPLQFRPFPYFQCQDFKNK